MSKFLGIILGAVEIAAGIYLEFVPGGQALGWYLIAGGAGAIIGNVGTLLSQPQGGLGTASRNPVMPWNVVYGRAKVGGTIVYINSFGDDDKYLDIVFVLASHPVLSIDALYFDNQRIPIDPTTLCSFTPTQQTMNIASIVRAYGVVTVTTTGVISDLQAGDKVTIQNVHGVTSIDRSLNGVVYVYEVISTTQFTFLSGGLDISLGTTGQVVTMWPDYRAKVYCEFLNGDHTATFNGMIFGTPYDGDPSNLIVPDYPPGNPWTAQHVLNGKACAFLRLHYNDEVFSAGLPQISFRLRGKKDIYDPRAAGGVAVASPTVLMNGWGNNAHEGPYEGGVDLGYTWGLNDDITNPYGGVAAATDGNPSSWCAQSYRHTHEYAGCIWAFPAVPPTSPATQLYINVLTAVPSSGPGSLRSAGMYYSLDGGATWTMIYDTAVRAEQWDNVTLPLGQDTSQVQVMAFMDSHDDMTHLVYEIQIGNAPVSLVSGYSENAALCIADYLANTTFGFKAAYGSEIPLAPLIAAANICDEPVDLADGSTEPRYLCNGNFQLTTSRGEILQNMLTACGGRITYSSGEFRIWPAAWAGVSLELGQLPVQSAYLRTVIGHQQGVGYTGAAVVNVTLPWQYPEQPAFSSQYVINDSSAFGATTVTSTWLGYPPPPPHQSQWSMQTDNGWIGLPYTRPEQTVVSIYDWGTLLGSTTPGKGNEDKVFLSDCWIDVTYSDGSSDVLRPRLMYVQPDSAAITTHNAGLDPLTWVASGEIWRTSWGGAQNPATVQLAGFQSSAPRPPDWTKVPSSREVLGITAGPFTWKSKLPIRELYNGCKGMYISPANGWQNSDFPPYAQDADHGYNGPADFEGDQNLADDGGDRRWLEIQLPFTISPFGSQRLAKIELMRKRQQGMGTFSFNMSLYKTTALDIVALTLPILGWNGKLLEVSAHRLVFNRNEGGPTLGCELDLQETDPSVYEWSVTEQLAPQGPGLGVLPITSQTGAPATVTATSNSSTSVIGADGIARSQLLVTWPAPSDGFVTEGGHVEIQYQQTSSPSGPWMSAPSVDPNATQAYIGGVKDGATYTVQVRYVNAAGSPGAWTAAPPVTVSGAGTSLPPANISGSGASPGDVLIWTGSPPAWQPGPATAGGGVDVFEIPSGALDGVNRVFTLSLTPVGKVRVFRNGVFQDQPRWVSVSGVTVTFVVAPRSRDHIFAVYQH